VKPVTGPKRTLFGTFFDVRNLMKVSERAGCDGATRHTPTTSRLRLRTDSCSVATRTAGGIVRIGYQPAASADGPDHETPRTASVIHWCSPTGLELFGVRETRRQRPARRARSPSHERFGVRAKLGPPLRRWNHPGAKRSCRVANRPFGDGLGIPAKQWEMGLRLNEKRP